MWSFLACEEWDLQCLGVIGTLDIPGSDKACRGAMHGESSQCVSLKRLVTGLSHHSLHSRGAFQQQPQVWPASSVWAQGISESSRHRRMAILKEMPQPHHLNFVERGPEGLKLEKRKIWAPGQGWESWLTNPPRRTRLLPKSDTRHIEVAHLNLITAKAIKKRTEWVTSEDMDLEGIQQRTHTQKVWIIPVNK